ncbi:NAD-dependent epimerase/dehydratase family protein [Adhaeribacter sp. BT258]|uniref:NAD-dependent epimerase/dehydratase family protein n=1 Tax=Adhaeribacter terrigena TaxID=2793070 RepID=A0ABS1BZ84_9BACT|nr:NAD-dependent epimerase/dehydratase family protein [Adhaeribacter terrigena]MBK0402475.1 NAD-dependent epimerase/dehydratase family protein [Adhaeribacter terrigena]
MQTILGAGGAIGTELAKALKKYTAEIRLVSRNPEKVNATDQLFPADLTKAEEVEKAVAGSEVVYLVVGFVYKVSVWQKNWPALMQNVLAACKKHNAKLVFFDNMYMYDPAYLGHMTEETPVKPVSEKGKVRAQIAEMLLKETRSGNLTALIARAPDFIGPKNSVLTEMVYKNLKQGKKANWFLDADKVHSFIFTPDAAKATALLGNTPDAYNQVWHLPTSSPALTVNQWTALFAKELNTEARMMVLPRWMISLLGLFMPIVKESKEMLYQYDRDYVFDSSKFEKRFGIKATLPQESVKQLIKMLEN